MHNLELFINCFTIIPDVFIHVNGKSKFYNDIPTLLRDYTLFENAYIDYAGDLIINVNK